MPDAVLIPLPGIGTLDLPREVFERHLVREQRCETAAPVVELVDAAQLEARTGVPASWWLSQARERRVPCRKIGRRVRFDPAEVVACEAFQRRALTDASVIQSSATQQVAESKGSKKGVSMRVSTP